MNPESDNQHSAREALFISLLNNELNEDEKLSLLSIIESSPEIKANFEETQAIWGDMEMLTVPDVSMEMKATFYENLGSFKTKEKGSFWATLKSLFAYKPSYNWAYALLLLGTGSFIGYFMGQPSLATNQEVKRLSDEMQDMKQMMMISMLDNPIATERMKAVSYTQEMKEVDSQIIDALLTTLNSDDNVNVRLITLDALIELSESPKVREGLVLSLIKQESPLVQVALADAMIQLQEKRSVKELQQLLKKEGLNEMVKEKLEETITYLI
ncbi:MAG: hypothetical protein ACI9IP_002409 [Arcticibacterium sp.]|jgi:hypothetical protein